MSKKAAKTAADAPALKPAYAKLLMAWKRACPLVTLTTSDPAQTLREIVATLPDTHVIGWDCARGPFIPKQPKQEEAAKVKAKAIPDQEGAAPVLTDFLIQAEALDKGAVVVVQNAHRFLDSPEVVQAVWNLRDPFKNPKRMLILLGPSIKVPVELQHDVIEIDEPLPDRVALRAVLEGLAEAAQVEMDDEHAEDAAAACQGLSAFAAEQFAALNLTKETGISVRGVWADKCQKISETPGLKVISGGSFADVAGVEQAKKFLAGILNGRAKPSCIVFVDEIEKALAGAAGDTSGTSQDQLGVLLQYMQDRRASGAVFVGPPGAAKSALAKSAGGEVGIPTIQFDLGGMKGSLVGESETRIRDALKVVDSISDGRTLWIATCNSLAALPPELRRRFKFGIWYFSLPDYSERRAIWSLYCERYDLPAISEDDEILTRRWTGAEIESCCEMAWRLESTVEEAAAYIVPVSVAGAQQINDLESLADGKFLSASYPGVYRRDRDRAAEAIEDAQHVRQFE